MGNSTAEPAPAYEDLFHQPSSSQNGYAMVEQTDISENRDLEQGQPLCTFPSAIEPGQHLHCAECDGKREARERRASSQKACAMVAKTFILISLFMMILGIVGVQAWKEVRMKKLHSHS
ncbi:hypothetical protein N7489_009552 [Penicillium chrysogenum]|uniref:Uncharacterized protein n=1 Tax=Penicillium chrysogenum TaxID=5076 RepID=A0ABQ8WXV2_PENCH|nr:uncharacterized protein N7489_009552 [Penicillium chrysogenum]KAJ5228844.1 hypothetical protein N7489_009552 [Penicillium chrysogenum]KAJ5258247.1 hypothetical protein N7524_009803 [Penicillium chrysogenum]KAJ5283521.1 hypothetical protein N7505_001501 [Penicillium chrysogenum]KAJ6168678.1 hypothetical protein N7497_001521 [Penicillium chrysogenum]